MQLDYVYPNVNESFCISYQKNPREYSATCCIDRIHVVCASNVNVWFTLLSNSRRVRMTHVIWHYVIRVLLFPCFPNKVGKGLISKNTIEFDISVNDGWPIKGWESTWKGLICSFSTARNLQNNEELMYPIMAGPTIHT